MSPGPASDKPRKKARKKRAVDAPEKREPKKAARPKAPGPEHRRLLRIGAAIATLLVGGLYGATMCRWIGLGDTALLLNEMVELTLNSHVNNHKIAVVAGHILSRLPFGELAWRVNLTSVIFGTAAVVVMFAVALRTLGKLLPAMLSTLAIAVIHSMWWHSTIVENYAVNALALAVVLLLLLRDEEREGSHNFYAACAVAGLSAVNHVQNGILAIAVLAYAIAQRRKGQLFLRLVRMAGFYLLGFLPYLAILVRDMVRAPSAKQTLYWAFGGDFGSRMFDFDIAKVFRPLMTEFLIQFPSPLLVFVGLGVYYIGEVSWYGKTNIAMTAAFFVNTIFFSQFHTWDKFAFLLPSFLICGYWGVVGVRYATELAERREPRAKPAVIAALAAAVLMPPWIYRQLPEWGREEGFWHERFNNNFTLNTHDCAAYIANPDKSGWADVDEVAKLLLEKLPAQAIFLDDDARLYYPLAEYYQKHLGQRRDLRVVMSNSWGFTGWGMTDDAFTQLALASLRTRRVFVVSAQFPHQGALEKLAAADVYAQRFELDSHRWVYELVARQRGALEVYDVFTGRSFQSGLPVIKDRFERGEVIAVQARFLKNAGPVPVVFRWTDPAGAVHHESPVFDIPPGNMDVWSHLEGSGQRASGSWRVEIHVDQHAVGGTNFIIF